MDQGILGAHRPSLAWRGFPQWQLDSECTLD
jgi:hypothetical protein